MPAERESFWTSLTKDSIMSGVEARAMLKTRGGYRSAVDAEQTQGRGDVSKVPANQIPARNAKKSPRRCQKIVTTDHRKTPAPAYSLCIDPGHSQLS